MLRWLSLVLLSIIGMTAAQAQTVDDMQARTFSDGQGHVLPYRLLVPANYDRTRKYPLVMFLHGSGEKGTDNRRQVEGQPAGPHALIKRENQTRWPSFVLAPQCPTDQIWDRPRSTGSNWPLDAAIKLIDALQREFPGIDASRLLITGNSNGGFGTWDAITRYPGKFQKAAPVCGGGVPTNVAVIGNTPIWAFHSADDPQVPVSRSREMIAALRALGRTPRYTEYCANGLPCYAHFAWNGAYNDPGLLPWLFGSPAATIAAPVVTVPLAVTPTQRADQEALTAYPNPATGQFTLHASLPPAALATCTLTDPSGRVVRTQTGRANGEGSLSLPFDVAALPAGLYLLRVQQPGGKAQMRKIVVQP